VAAVNPPAAYTSDTTEPRNNVAAIKMHGKANEYNNDAVASAARLAAVDGRSGCAPSGSDG